MERTDRDHLEVTTLQSTLQLAWFGLLAIILLGISWLDILWNLLLL